MLETHLTTIACNSAGTCRHYLNDHSCGRYASEKRGLLADTRGPTWTHQYACRILALYAPGE